MNTKRIHSIYGICLSICTVVSGLLFISACIDIYHLGEHPFTPETVAAAFTSIALPVYICIALIFGGWILDGIYPAPKAKPVPDKNYTLILEKLYEKYGAVQTPAICAQQKSRKLHNRITTILFILGGILFLSYGLNSKHFDSADITGSVIKAMYVLLPCVTVVLAFSIYAVYHNRASLKKEIALVKEAVKIENYETVPVPKKVIHSSAAKLRWVLLATGIFLLVYGFFTGGTQDVLTKAVNICTECVGLG